MNGIPPAVISQVADAIKGAFREEELWRVIKKRTGEDLEKEIPQSLNLTDQVFELLDWLGKRGRTLEVLGHLNDELPNNPKLPAATAAYEAAEKDLLENPPPAAAFAQPPATASSSTGSGTGDGRSQFQMKPWMWILVGTVGLLVLVGLFVNSDPMERGDDADLDALWDRCATQDFVACDDLFVDSVDDSDYEAFATSCGNLTIAGNALDMRGGCFDYVDDLEFMATECEQGFFDMCDNLFLASPDGTLYEQLGSSCGGLEIDAILLDEQGGCVTFMQNLDS